MSSLSDFRERLVELTSEWQSLGAEAHIEHELADLSKRASAKERGLWREVHGRHPGQPDHDAVVWKRWVDAADEVRAIAEELRHLRSS
jgi:hypothetical protein